MSAGVLAGEHRVPTKLAVVRARMVDVVVESARFGTTAGAGHDQVGHEPDIPELDQVRVEPVTPVITLGLLPEHGHHGGRPGEALVASDDAHIIPHDP